VTLLEKDEDLKPEMSAKVTFLEPESVERPAADAARPRPVILVPQAAVVSRNGHQQVFEVVNGTAQMRPIKTSGTRRDQLIVIDGLAGSETLVARPPDSLADGTAVRVKGA
jgi:multidrug efflux pump subunit AcrA (membrane-fusion protein)